MVKKFPLLKLYFKQYSYAIILFTMFRVAFLFLNQSELKTEIDLLTIWAAFGFGFRFDTVIIFYLLALIWLLHLLHIFLTKSGYSVRLINVTFAIGLGICILIFCADVPFYQHFQNRLNQSVFNWNDHLGFAFKMVLMDSEMRYYLIAAILIFCLHFLLFYKIFKVPSSLVVEKKIALRLQLLILPLLLLGIRGRTSLKSPIRSGLAYFSPYPFINQLGLNPIFTFLKSITEKKSEQLLFLDKIISKTEAIKNFNALDTNKYSNAYFQFKDTIHPPNVILILMEGMSANYFKRYGNTRGLTPGLDSLMQHSINFDYFYSAGTHTFNGVYSSTQSRASLPGVHPMKISTLPSIQNVIQQLNAANYKTVYWTTHDDQFDNIGGFLTHTGFSTIVAQKDYLKSEVKSNLGVPDHILYKYAEKKLKTIASDNKPFFATIMTASNHEPFIFPDDIQLTYKTKSEEERIKEYSDFATTQFINAITKYDWGKRTIFVITGDHGKAIDHDYEISMSYHHIPLIIYSPSLLQVPQYLKNIGSQVDIMPTIQGMLAMPYKTAYQGKNIFEIKKEFIVSVADEKVLVLDSLNLLIFSKDIEGKYYDLKTKKSLPQDEKSKRMKIYAATYLQAARND